MHREFVGTTSVTVDLDPSEYQGTVPEITDQVMEVLRSIAPGVSFFESDVVETACHLAEGFDNQMAIAREIMDEHSEALARPAD